MLKNEKDTHFENRVKGAQIFVSCILASIFAACSIPFIQSQKEKKVDPDLHLDFKFQPQLAPSKGPFKLEFEPALARTEVARVYSRTQTRTTAENQLRHEREETVDFTVKTDVKSVDVKSGDRGISVETIRKDGPVDLYDLGYPEPGEIIDYVYNRRAQVKKAGHFPSNSLFFLPPVALPGREVEIGDTWQYKVDWISLKNGLPLSLDLVSIAKRLFECPLGGRCMEIELSGEISLPEAITKGATMESHVVGRLLYKLETGSILWSYVKNTEKLASNDGEMQVETCTESLLEEPADEKWPWRARAQCDPHAPLANSVPGYAIEEK